MASNLANGSKVEEDKKDVSQSLLPNKELAPNTIALTQFQALQYQQMNTLTDAVASLTETLTKAKQDCSSGIGVQPDVKKPKKGDPSKHKKTSNRDRNAHEMSDSYYKSDSYSDCSYESDREFSGDELEAQFDELAKGSEDSPVNDGDANDQLEQLADFFESEEKCGPEVSGGLAKTLNRGMRSRIAASKIDEVADKYLRPKNCDNLSVPKVNPEIWDKMSDTAQGRDIGFQKLQAQLLKAVVIQARLMDDVLKAMKEKQHVDVAKCWKQSSHGFQMLAHTFSQMSQKRRDLIRPEVGKQYRRLCSANTPITSLLFGDELNKQIKEITDADRVGNKLSTSSYYQKGRQSHRHQPYPYKKHYDNKRPYNGNSYNGNSYKQSGNRSVDFPKARQYRHRKKSGSGNNHHNNNNNRK